MGCPCLSSCLLRQMSAVSTAITAQLNINDSLAWQVLAGQRRGERGTPLDKTRWKGEVMALSAWQILFCLSELAYMYVCHQQILGLTWQFYCPVFPPVWGDGPLCVPNAPHPSYWHFWHSFKYLCMCKSVFVCRLVCLSMPLLICRSTCVSFLSSCVLLIDSILDFDVGNMIVWWQFTGKGRERRGRPNGGKGVGGRVCGSVFSKVKKLPFAILLWLICFFVCLHSFMVSFSILALVYISCYTLHVVTQAYGLFPHLSFELLTPQLRGVNGYCWVDTAQIRHHIAHISEVRPFKGITLLVPSAPSLSPCILTHTPKHT